MVNIQGDVGRIRVAYLKVVKGIATITFPMMAGLMIVSREFILVIVGTKWEGVILPLRVLCLVGALQSVGTTVGSIFNSLGRADLQFKTGIINSMGHIIGFIVCIRWGLMGIVKGYLVTNIIFVCSTQLISIRLIQLSVRDLLQSLKMPLLNTTILVLVLLSYKHIWHNLKYTNNAISLFTTVALGIVVYIGSTLLLMNRNQINELKEMFGKKVNQTDSTALMH